MDSPRDRNEQQEFRLSQYLDGQLDDAARAALERELSSDADLREALEQMRRIDRLVRRWGEQVPRVDPGRFVVTARLRRVKHDRGRQIVRLYRLFAPLAAAAVIALVVTGYVFVRSGPPAGPAVGPAVTVVAVGPAGRSDRPVDGREPAVAIVSFSRRPAADHPVAAEPRRTLLLATAGRTPSTDLVGIDDEEPPVF